MFRDHAAAEWVVVLAMFVMEVTESVGQAEGSRPEAHREPIRKPFRQKIDPGLALVTDVGAHIQKPVVANRFQEIFAQPATAPRTQPLEGERDDADEGATRAQIEWERHALLQDFRCRFVVNENGAIPAREEERFAAIGQQALFGRLAQFSGGRAVRG